MPERHRGAHPHDAKAFAKEKLPQLKRAVEELSWHLSRGYAMGASNELVGDRYQLTSRQRLAIARVACAGDERDKREAKRVSLTDLKEERVVIDGFNLLITIETALGGGAIFRSLDGCCRDLSAVYGSYKVVEETRRAIEMIGMTLEKAAVKKALWYFDRPVSNSGRVAKMVRDIAEERGWPFDAELTDRTDALLSRSHDIVISCDSAILERAEQWCNLACSTIEQHLPDVWFIDLTSDPQREKS